MPTLKDLVRESYNGHRLVVTGPHYDWMEMTEPERMPSEQALVHVLKTLLQQYKHPRKHRFSPSSMGECPRRMLFGYAGAPQKPSDPELDEMAGHGSFGHLRWQFEGLSLGYMTAAEVWVEDPDLMSGGSMDGELEDGSIFELKTKAPGVYNRIVVDNREPIWENLLQVHNYFLLSGAEWASVVYEDRAYGNFHEFRVARDSKIEREVIRRLNSYRRYVEDDLLPPVLADCELAMGKVYKQCPYRGEVCLGPAGGKPPRTVTEAEAIGAAAPVSEEIVVPEWAHQLLALLPPASEQA